MTQRDVVGTYRTKKSTIGLGSWFIDLHTAERAAVRVNGSYALQNLGQVCQDYPKRNFWVFEIPYTALVPRRQECTNLIVPVCISATRVAFSAFRLETQYMIAGQAAGVAAILSLKAASPVQDVDVPHLQSLLEQQGQVLHGRKAAPSHFNTTSQFGW